MNRIEIVGNDYHVTSRASATRSVLVPGDVFNRDYLIRSYQNIGNLGFFETPLPPPDTSRANEQGDVDIIFNVKEKRTGNVNFGASVGQGTGVGGFIGLDQPNLLRPVQARLAPVAVRPLHQRLQPHVHRSASSSRGLGKLSRRTTRSRATSFATSAADAHRRQLQFGFPVPSSLLHAALHLVRRREGAVRQRGTRSARS